VLAGGLSAGWNGQGTGRVRRSADDMPAIEISELAGLPVSIAARALRSAVCSGRARCKTGAGPTGRIAPLSNQHRNDAQCFSP